MYQSGWVGKVRIVYFLIFKKFPAGFITNYAWFWSLYKGANHQSNNLRLIKQ